jgi:hypothetical protein
MAWQVAATFGAAPCGFARADGRCCLCRLWSAAACRRFAVVGLLFVVRLLPVAECLPFDTLGKRVFAGTPKMAVFALRMVVSDA